MDLILEDDGSGSYTSAPQAFKDALTFAADYLDNLITNAITVTIEVGYGTFEGSSFGSDVFAEGGPEAGKDVTYSNLVGYLNASANSNDDTTAYSNLPATSPYPNTDYYLSPAQEKVFGLLSANSHELDGSVGFATEANGDFDYSTTDRAMPGEYDFVGVALHELTHALGRIADFTIGAEPTILDLFRYSAQTGAIDTSGRIHAQDYFSIDGGTTNLDNFDKTGSDPGDWGVNTGAGADDANNAFAAPDAVNAFTQTDITEMDVLGFNVNSSPAVGLSALSVTASPGSGDFGAGVQIAFTVTFSGNAIVTGTPVLDLNDNGTAAYQSGSGTNALTFLYTVGTGDLSDAALAVTGIDLTNGAVKDGGNNAADFTDLPTTFGGLQIDPSLPTTFTWTNVAGGDWNTPSNWSPAGTPIANSTALLTLPGTYTVTSGQDNSVAVLNMAKNATLKITAGTLDVTAGTGALPGALAGTIDVLDGASLEFGSDGSPTSFVNSGTIALNSSGHATDLIVAGSATLGGAGKIVLSDNAANAIASDGSAAILTNGSVSSGNTLMGAGTLGDSHLSIVNGAKGKIVGDGVNNPLEIETLNNLGIVEGTTGQGAMLLSNASNANLLEALGTSARLALNGIDLTDTAKGVLEASGTGAHVDIDLSGVAGGSLKTSGTSAVINVIGAGASTFDGSMAGLPLNVSGTVAVNDGSTLKLKGSIVNAGTLKSNSTGDATGLIVSGAVKLSGAGKVVLSNNVANEIVSDGNVASLANGNAISGAGSIGDADLSLDNQVKGIIDATGTQLLTLDAAGLTNEGKIEATGAGSLLISHTAVVDSAAGTVAAAATGTFVYLDNASISGGKVSTVKGATVETFGGGSGTITAGVSNAGTLAADAGDLTVNGNVTNSGTLSASAHVLTLNGTVTGGVAKIAAEGTIAFGANDTKIKENVSFLNNGGTETLQFAASATGVANLIYNGTISGFSNPNDVIDFTGLAFQNATTPNLKLVGANTLVTVTEGADAVSFLLAGNHMSDNFTVSKDGGTGTQIVDPPATHFAQTIASFAVPGAGASNATRIANTSESFHDVLATSPQR